MKKHNTLWLVIFTILFVALLSWILPITYLDGGFVTDARNQVGLTDLLTYPSYLIYNFGYIVAIVLVVGGFYGLLNKTGAYRTLLEKITKHLKGREIIWLVITVLFTAVIISLTGFTYEALIFFPFIIGIILMLGYDKIVASLVTVGSIAVGIIGSTFSSLVNGTFNEILNANSTVVKTTSLIWVKVALLVVCSLLLIGYILLYVKNNPRTNKIEESMFIPEKNEGSKSIKLWPLITVLSVMTVIIIMGYIGWNSIFGITCFDDFIQWLTNLRLFDYPVVSKIIGTNTLTAFGSWSYNELLVFLVFTMIVIKFIYKVKFVDMFDSMFDGAKEYLYPAIVIGISYTVLIVTSNHPVILTILKPILELTNGFNSITLTFSSLVSALFNSDLTFYNYGILPLTYVTTAITDTTVYPLCELITQSTLGFALLIAPTSACLLFNLSTLKITYGEWLKKTWMLLLALLLVMIVAFTIILLVI